jgi:hypothetical protein
MRTSGAGSPVSRTCRTRGQQLFCPFRSDAPGAGRRKAGASPRSPVAAAVLAAGGRPRALAGAVSWVSAPWLQTPQLRAPSSCGLPLCAGTSQRGLSAFCGGVRGGGGTVCANSLSRISGESCERRCTRERRIGCARRVLMSGRRAIFFSSMIATNCRQAGGCSDARPGMLQRPQVRETSARC